MLTVLCPGKGHLQWPSCLWILLPGQQCEGPALGNWSQRFLNHGPHTLLLSPNSRVHVTFLSTIRRQKTLLLDAWHLWKQSDPWGLRGPEGRGAPFRNESPRTQVFLRREAASSALTHLHSTRLPRAALPPFLSTHPHSLCLEDKQCPFSDEASEPHRQTIPD